MENDKNTLIAFLLIFLVIILFWWFNAPQVDQGVAPNHSNIVTDSTKSDSQTTQSPKSEPVVTPVEKTELPENAVPVTHFPSVLAPENNLPQSIIVESELFSGKITTKGATVRSWKLKNYGKPKSKKVDGEVLENDWVEMIGPNKNFLKYYGDEFVSDLENYNFNNLAISLPLNEGVARTGEFIFELGSEKKHIVLDPANPTDSLTFVLKFSNGGLLRKTYIFYNNRYDFDLRVELTGINELLTHSHYWMRWESGLSPTESDIQDDMNYAKGYVLTRKDLVIEEPKDEEDKEEIKPITGRIDWMGTTTKYFGVNIIPMFTAKDGYDLLDATVIGDKIQIGPNKELEWRRINLGLKIPTFSNETISHIYKVYLGPLDYFGLKKYNLKLEKIIDLGMRWLRPISIGILYAFTKLHSFIPNYGLVIIIFSILVKILLHPLTKKSYSSMKKMQELQPELNALKDKHKDPKKLQQAQLQLYKEKGVNPAGGCLPMLLQMPLLFALYWVFRNTIELRGEPFIWWITDLSMPDTLFNLGFSLPLYGDKFNILPILMGVSMLFQQQMTMKDPKQKAMVYIMPIFMILIFNKMSSGLNLYYTLFNVFSLIQQKFTKTEDAAEKAPDAPAAPSVSKPITTPGKPKRTGTNRKK